MNELHAISIHVPALDELGPGAVLSVASSHQRALNLVGPGGRMLSLVHPALGNGPGALVVPGPWPLPLAPGDPVSRERDSLVSPTARVHFAGAHPWIPPPAPRRVTPDLARAVRSLAVLGSRAGLLPAALGALQYEMVPRPGGIAGALLDMGLEGIEGLRRQDWQQAVRRLAGLGPGLTPSGDDLLCGYLLCLHRAADARAGALAAAVGSLPGSATTPLSRHLLRWAAQGVAGEHHMNWLDSLLTGNGEAHLGPLLAHGATSGADWAAGALLAASTLRKGD